MMRSITTAIAVAAVCCCMTVPAQAGGGGGSKGNVTVKVKNVGTTGFGAAVVSGTTSTPPSATSAYKALAPEGGTANFSVKKGTFTLFGGTPPATIVLGPKQLQTFSGRTTYVHADADNDLATVVTANNF